MNTPVKSLRHCAQCRRPETGDSKLRKCGACSAVLYCSPQCQREAWPVHKVSCTGPGEKPPDSDAHVLRYGYSSISACHKDLQDFIRAHVWALRVNTKARCHLYFDAQADRELLIPPRLLAVRLACNSTLEHHERNPASKFSIIDQKFGDLNWYIRKFPEAWNNSEPSRAELLRTWTRHAQFLGILTVAYYLPNTYACLLDFHPIYRLGQYISSGSQLRRRSLLDMLDLCTASVNCGFPLRTLDEVSRAPVALPGRYVRKNGKVWQWKALFGDWKDYVPGKHEALDTAVSAISTGLHISELMCTILNY